MSDNEVANQDSLSPANPGRRILVVSVILALLLGTSITVLGDATVVPYDEGGKEDIPSAAARLCNLKSSRVADGCAYMFDIEVFATCWTPVYAVEIEGLLDAVVEPAAWPEGWKAGTAPSGLTGSGSMVFYTLDDPILPGTERAGFGVVSYSGSASLRWFPADKDGILIGKVSRVDLSCPLGNEPRSWGSIKALYR
jgi:hypothetical protein